jgi:hypothetical protein
VTDKDEKDQHLRWDNVLQVASTAAEWRTSEPTHAPSLDGSPEAAAAAGEAKVRRCPVFFMNETHRTQLPYLTCRIGRLDPIWQPRIGSSFR